jgi:hypothetical protein
MSCDTTIVGSEGYLWNREYKNHIHVVLQDYTAHCILARSLGFSGPQTINRQAYINGCDVRVAYHSSPR